MRVEGELHVMLNRNCGHEPSVDCWCEPTRIYFATVRGLPGVTKVVEHEDDRSEHHIVTLNKRERDRDLTYDPDHSMGLDDAWITRTLSFDEPPN